MGLYLYEHPETGEIKEVFQKMKDKHTYYENGIEWKRVFTIPQASIDSRWESENLQKCVEKTGKMKGGTLGQLFDKSQELSEARTQLMGHDPIKEDRMTQWSKERGGKKYVDQKKIKDLVVEI